MNGARALQSCSASCAVAVFVSSFVLCGGIEGWGGYGLRFV